MSLERPLFERRIFEEVHDQFRDSVRRFMQTEIAPHAARWRAQGHVDRSVFLKAGEQGYLLMWADEEYGGAGIKDFRYEQILIEENWRFGEPGLLLTLHSRLVGPYIGKLGSQELRARLLPKCVTGEHILAIAMTEPETGSDLAGMRSLAVDKGDYWLLNGSKTFISNGQLGDLIIVAARTVPDKRHRLGLFIVERGMEGFERGRNLAKMGLAAQDTSELFFKDVKIPKANVLGDATQGLYYLAELLVEERLVVAVQSIAHAQAAWDLTLGYVRERRVFGKPIGAFQNSRFKLAELRSQLDAIQVFVDHCVMEHCEDRLRAEQAAEAKLLATELEGRVMDECLQLHGGAGYMDEYRISRMYADARAARIYAGSSEIMKEIISGSIGLDDRKIQNAPL